VLIVLNNCTTMGPKYVDRKVMKASRAMAEQGAKGRVGKAEKQLRLEAA